MKSERQSKKILFVCTGNSCRSVMAEGILRQMLERMGLHNVQVMSAGTNPVPGMGPTPETIEVMRRQGVDVSAHVNQFLSPELVAHADAIFCMEEHHKEEVLSLDPAAEGKVHLLRSFENSHPGDFGIPDPIGQPLSVYQQCALVIREAVERVAQWIERS